MSVVMICKLLVPIYVYGTSLRTAALHGLILVSCEVGRAAVSGAMQKGVLLFARDCSL